MAEKTIVYGESPYSYSYHRTEEFTEEVVVQTYTLNTGDWFEVGGAYSLHPNLEKARSYTNVLIIRWYPRDGSPISGFVSPSTLELILAEEDEAIFRTWGH